MRCLHPMIQLPFSRLFWEAKCVSLHLLLRAEVTSAFSRALSTFLSLFSLLFNFLMLLNSGWDQVRIPYLGHQLYIWLGILSLPLLHALIPTAPSHSGLCREGFAAVSDHARVWSWAVNLYYQLLDVYCSVRASDSSFFGKSTDLYPCTHTDAHVKFNIVVTLAGFCCICKTLRIGCPGTPMLSQPHK